MTDNCYAYHEVTEQSSSEAGKSRLRVTVQSNMSVKGWPTDAGSLALEKYVALEDSALIENLKKAHVTIPGSTRMAELGFGIAGDAASVIIKEDSVDACLVTDTLGEARHTAAMSATIGFKPSYGICSRYGLIGLVPSMECTGVVARDIDVIAVLMQAMSLKDQRDISMLTSGIPDFTLVAARKNSITRLGIIREVNEHLEENEREALTSALSRMSECGLEVVEISIPDFSLIPSVHAVIAATEASSAAGKYDGVRYGHRAAGTSNWNEMYLKSRAESFGILLKSFLFQGAYYQFKNYEAFEDACRIRRRLLCQAHTAFEGVGAFVLPTRRLHHDAAAATTVSQVYDAFSLTAMASLLGFPAVSIPGFVAAGNVDCGLQIVAPYLHDVEILAVAGHCQKGTN